MTARVAPSVLLLEDQALVRAGMRALIELTEPQAIVMEAASHAEAVALLAPDPPDIAFLDVTLKEAASGLDVLREIRRRQLPTRAVMLSADSGEATMTECLRLGASGYIIKDMDPAGLFRRALDTVFGGGVFLPPHLTSADAPSADVKPPPAPPTPETLGIRGRAVEALYYLCQGYSNQLIAHRMGVAESTVANDYNTRLFRLFRVTNRAALIVEVARRGLVILPPGAAARKAER
jgi:two-component system nitrate/nitrite response regulator NarL